ncbi:MAG: hypothetical protein NT160_02585, partial [Actinobacteria bacterium]|nr:hypothetical protein [Actinomycetota bacterium]
LLTTASIDESRVQVISERSELPSSMTLDAETMKTVLSMIQGAKLDDFAWVQAVELEDRGERLSLKISVGSHEIPHVPIAEAKQDLYTLLGARPELLVDVELDQPPIRRVLARMEAVPAFGWKAFNPAELAHPAKASIVDGVLAIANELVTVSANAEDASFSINGKAGFGKFVDGGDLGDSYNYSPPAKDSLVDRPSKVSILTVEEGPVRATLEITATYHLPEFIDGTSQERCGDVETIIVTRVSVIADSPKVEVQSSVLNQARDHRLRIHLPLVEPTEHSDAECAFAVVSRGLSAEGRSEEFGLPTFPSRRFVVAGGLTIAHEGLNEYELVDIENGKARTLALTMLRSTGMLSRLGMAYRPFPAGPLTPVEGLQMLGKQVTCRYTISLGDADPWLAAADLHGPLEVAQSPGGGDREPQGSAFAMTGAQLSSLRRVAGGILELRVFNPTDQETVVDLFGRPGWLVDLRGVATERVKDSFTLRAQGIATVWLEAGESG